MTPPEITRAVRMMDKPLRKAIEGLQALDLPDDIIAALLRGAVLKAVDRSRRPKANDNSPRE